MHACLGNAVQYILTTGFHLADCLALVRRPGVCWELWVFSPYINLFVASSSSLVLNRLPLSRERVLPVFLAQVLTSMIVPEAWASP